MLLSIHIQGPVSDHIQRSSSLSYDSTNQFRRQRSSTVRSSRHPMAQISPPLASFLFIVLLFTATPTAASLPYFFAYSSYKTLFSLSHSLLTRVSNLRAARGDLSGAIRAKALAQKLERGLGLGFWRMAWSVGWDYARNYKWRDFDYGDLHGVVSELSELAGYLTEVARFRSDAERAAWLGRNYGKVLGVVKSVLDRLLKVFRQSGALKEVMETVQKEVVDGELLRDCIELGSNDLKGLVLIIKDFAFQYFSTSHHNDDL